MIIAEPPIRSFVPAQINLAQFDALEPLYRGLLDRSVETAGQLVKWLADFAELSAAVDEYGSRRYIEKSCNTEDKQIEQRYLDYVEKIEPKVKPFYFQLQKKFLDSPVRAALTQTDAKYVILARKWQSEVDLFREANIPLETELTKLANEYDKTMGEMMVAFRDGQYTPQQMGRFIEDNNRATRQAAWEAVTERRLRDRESVEAVFDRQLPIRQQVAANAGLPDYRAFVWKSLKRFDYTPEDCLKFAKAIAMVCVPLVQKLNEQRAKDLGLERLRPWDLEVDPHNRPPLRPFAEPEVDLFVSKTREIFRRLSPDLAKDFDELSRHDNLDLASRKGKQPGGYQSSLEESKQPFIFMNAAGLHRDVDVLLHEGGHAFHFLAARNELLFLRSAPMEFCEVASMAMELLGSEHFGVFYSDTDAARARRKQFEGIIRFLPWMATIDSFQHWIYTHPGHTPTERTTEWLRLLDRFSAGIDWSGYETARATRWQNQLHLYHVPFYYIEYGIAQLGALQVWTKAKQDPRRALANYRAGLALGGTRPLPQLFAAAGINFDFSEKTLRPLIGALEEELEQLPA